MPYLTGMEFRFFDDPEKLAAAYRDGTLDAVSGLSPDDDAAISDQAGDSTVLRYPGSTLTAVLLNLRPGHPEFANPAVRTALLAAIDRAADRRQMRSPVRRHGDGRHPAVLVRCSTGTADPPVAYDPAAAQMALLKAGWTSRADGLALPNAKTPLDDRAAQPGPGIEPGRLPDRRDRDRRLAGDRARR